jgi:iron complex outermembrane receptor protein
VVPFAIQRIVAGGAMENLRRIAGYYIRPQRRHRPLYAAPCLLSLIICLTGQGAYGLSLDSPTQENDFAHMSLEELANVPVTSVSKKSEPLSLAAASIYVITRDDIRRSGATRLPEALRLAPNLQVVRISASQYTMTARGFNSTDANKLLVLIDGRSVYTPLFSGVFWDVQDVMLEDIDRIEVISGPAGTLWGTNAVNGVINIITRSAKRTQGAVVSGFGGNRESGGEARYGAGAGEDGDFRVYGKYYAIDHTSLANGSPIPDSWHSAQAGVRYDWARSGNEFSLQGNAYQGAEGQPLPGTISISGINFVLGTISLSGSNVTAHGSHSFDDGSTLSVQAYFDQTKRVVPPSFTEDLHIYDIEVQHSFRIGTSQNVEWGGELRGDTDQVTNSTYFGFLPGHVNQHWSSLFAQDDWSINEAVHATLGSRVESNPYTGAELLPSARIAWSPTATTMFWSAVSRAVRSPSRLDHDTYIPEQPPFLLGGGPNVRSETVNVYELGYRGRPTADSTLSATIFHADYKHLRTEEINLSPLLVYYANNKHGYTNGLELWGTYQVMDNWRVSVGMNTLRERVTLNPGSDDPTGALSAGADPANTCSLRSAWDLPGNTELDLAVRHVASLSAPSVPAYTSTDLRVGWHASHHLELSLAGQNLFDQRHGEFTDISTRSYFGRSVIFRLSARF